MGEQSVASMASGRPLRVPSSIVARALPHPNRLLRVIGFDDAPWRRTAPVVHLSGVVCAGTRFEGMVWGEAVKDGWDGTEVIAELVTGSKYVRQIHALLLDGISIGGLNLIDLPALAETIDRPCIAVMRKEPDVAAMTQAIRLLPEPDRRLEYLHRAGPIHQRAPFVFQVAGLEPDLAHEVLVRTTDRGHVPEALRLAHLIGSAVIDGQSRGRA